MGDLQRGVGKIFDVSDHVWKGEMHHCVVAGKGRVWLDGIGRGRSSVIRVSVNICNGIEVHSWVLCSFRGGGAFVFSMAGACQLPNCRRYQGHVGREDNHILSLA